MLARSQGDDIRLLIVTSERARNDMMALAIALQDAVTRSLDEPPIDQ